MMRCLKTIIKYLIRPHYRQRREMEKTYRAALAGGGWGVIAQAGKEQ